MALESLILQSGLDVSARAVKELVARAIAIVIQVSQLPDHSRKVVEIVEVEGLDYERSIDFPPYKLQPLYRFQFSHYNQNEKGCGEFIVTRAPSWLADLKLIPGFQVPDFWQ